jgi:2-polyprenyl-3-methyl-5-hydroxy-6-metoxy-1,4-benzoquinol methylase
MKELRTNAYRQYVTTHQGDVANRGKAHDFESNFLQLMPQDRAVRILDVGCGQGVMLRLLEQAGYQSVTGIDTSPEQIALAKEAGCTCAVCADLFEFAASTVEQFDVLLAIDLVEHFDRQDVLGLFSALYRMLAPGGRLILRTPNGSSPFAGRYHYSDITHGVIYTDRSLRQIASLVGFRSVEVFPAAVTGTRFEPVRRMLWRATEMLIKIPLIIETGELRGHVVTQNLVAVATKPA